MPRARARERDRLRQSVRPSEVEAGRRRRRRTCHPSYNGDERKIGGEVTKAHVAHIVHGGPAHGGLICKKKKLIARRVPFATSIVGVDGFHSIRPLQ